MRSPPQSARRPKPPRAQKFATPSPTIAPSCRTAELASRSARIRPHKDFLLRVFVSSWLKYPQETGTMATVVEKPHPFAAAKAAGREPFKVRDLSFADFC